MLLSIPLERADLWRGLPPIMQAVADPDTFRYDMGEPWIDGRHIYASDGRILVRARIDDFKGYSIGEIRVTDFPASASSMFDHEWRAAGNRIPLSAVEMSPPVIVCPECLGTGCEDCDYDGQCLDFSGRIAIDEDLDLGGRYISVLCAHGVTEVFRAVDPAVLQVYFRTGLVEGILMPLNPETADERARRERCGAV
jgi:hypothetical protein